MIFTRIEPERPEVATVVSGLGAAIEAVGTKAFAERFSELMLKSFKVTEFLVFHRPSQTDGPLVLYSEGLDEATANRARSYCRDFYRLDPIYTVLDDSNRDGIYAIRVRADEIRNAAFRNTCYSQPGISEKLTLAAKSDGDIIAISVFARQEDGGFDAIQVSELSHFGNLLLPILRLHFRLMGNAERPKQVSAQDMEDCVSWTFPELTKREVAVCARTILGVTAEGIALDLGIKQTSVLTYRRRAYVRLNINSINQLSTMLIQSSAARQLAAA